MRVVYGLEKLGRYKRPVVALGVFDGVHRAHRRIILAAAKKARQIKGTSIVLTFWPHPQKQGSLYSLEHRLRLLSELGVEVAVVVPFKRAFSRLPAARFIDEILAGRLNAGYIYVGRNFRFGQGARGDYRLLEKKAAAQHYRLKVFSIIRHKGAAISSTVLRNLISRGRLSQARELLLRPVSVLGTVIHGASVGAILGFPTANINPHHEVLPPDGIYATRVLLGKKKYCGACYIGTKPTLKKVPRRSIEVYILNFGKKIYGQTIEVQFLKKLRPDKKFPSLSALTRQVNIDISRVKRFIPRNN
jgi:riboflavin kinase / FMN adenylyltransferase